MSGKLSHDLFSLWFRAPVVIALRCQNWTANLAAGTAWTNPELHRMISEKAAAATESALAMNRALLRDGMTSFQRHWLGGQSIAAKGTRPYAKRVRANAKRLSRKPR